MNTPGYEFRFTRHGLSCNNMKAGESWGKAVKKDWEPSIHDFSLEQLKEPLDTDGTLDQFKRYSHEDRLGVNNYDYNFTFDSFKQPLPKIYVVVSPLIRTWETAVLLYGVANPGWTEMHLYIGPYLKEKFSYFGLITLYRGNYFKEPKEIIPQFHRFLDTIKQSHPAIGTGTKNDYFVLAVV